MAKYYNENKERVSKKACKRYQNLSKEETQKKWQYDDERYKNLSHMKNKSLSIEKNIIQCEKRLYYNYKKVL